MGGTDAHLSELTTALAKIAEADGLDGIADALPSAARRLIRSDGATFILRDGNECHYVTEDAVSPLWAGQRFPLTSCISGWAMLNNTPAAIENIYADPRIPVDAYRPTFVSSLAMVPIPGSEPIGAIGVYWADNHMPTAQELSLLDTLAEAASLAIEDALAESRTLSLD